MWADGFNGLLSHIEDRTTFVVSSPDDPSTQKQFAKSMGWKFQMISTKGTSFAKDMGFEQDGMPKPGVFIFYKKDGTIIVLDVMILVQMTTIALLFLCLTC